VPQVGGIALPQAGVNQFLQRERGRDAVEHRERLHLRGGTRRVRAQHVKHVLHEGDTVGADDRPGDGESGQPRVTAQHDALLLAHGDEVGQPVPGRR